MNERINQGNKTREAIYQFIKLYIAYRKYSPSVRDICRGVNLSSTCTVHGHLQKLKKEGLINYDKGIPRSITLQEVA